MVNDIDQPTHPPMCDVVLIFLSGGFGSNRILYSPHRADCTRLNNEWNTLLGMYGYEEYDNYFLPGSIDIRLVEYLPFLFRA
jgi:hypothetical protein